jgi:predicted O-methyltransferase YrrM
MDAWRLFTEYFKWFRKAKNLHGVHSPFMFDFNRNCLNKRYEGFDDIEHLRRQLLKNNHLITYIDPGAGSRKATVKKGVVSRKIRDIAKYSLQKPQHCVFLYSLATYLKARNILEMGTSFGITTSYLAKTGAEIDTIEGAEAIADIAADIFAELQYRNINLHKGHFDDVVPLLLTEEKIYDIVFIDGDHRGEALLKHFDNIVKHISEHSVIVIDDIRWSESMYDAWKKISDRVDVTVSADLFSMGLIFFRKGMSREKFFLRFR